MTLRGLADPDAERALRIFARDDLDYRDLTSFSRIVRAAAGNLYAMGKPLRDRPLPPDG
jgi:hypothetical protein